MSPSEVGTDDIIAQLNGVAGGHARAYYEFAPRSIVARLTLSTIDKNLRLLIEIVAFLTLQWDWREGQENENLLKSSVDIV